MVPEARVAAWAAAALAAVLALAEAPWVVAAWAAAHFLRQEHHSSNQ